MKRYLLFAGETHYPGGGWDDFVNDADVVEDLKGVLEHMGQWWHIVDTETGKVVQGRFTDDSTVETFEPTSRYYAVHNGFIKE